MFIDKQLGQDRKWINIDSDMIAENSYLYKKYEIDKETIEYAMDKNERAIWITIEKTVRSPLSTMYWI